MKTTTMSKDPNVTRDGIPVQPAQVWEDCDPRSPQFNNGVARTVTIDRVENGTAFATTCAGRPTRIAVKRLYPHSTGYRLRQP